VSTARVVVISGASLVRTLRVGSKNRKRDAPKAPHLRVTVPAITYRTFVSGITKHLHLQADF
jgi:hypothetical protein